MIINPKVKMMAMINNPTNISSRVNGFSIVSAMVEDVTISAFVSPGCVVVSMVLVVLSSTVSSSSSSCSSEGGCAEGQAAIGNSTILVSSCSLLFVTRMVSVCVRTVGARRGNVNLLLQESSLSSKGSDR